MNNQPWVTIKREEKHRVMFSSDDAALAFACKHSAEQQTAALEVVLSDGRRYLVLASDGTKP